MQNILRNIQIYIVNAYTIIYTWMVRLLVVWNETHRWMVKVVGLHFLYIYIYITYTYATYA